jgi:hypothetical protein
MITVDTLLAEIRALAPAGASVSVGEVVWSHDGGKRVTREWSASVHIDGFPCPHGGFGMVAHETADSPELLVARVRACMTEPCCVCWRCRDDRDLARLEAHDIDSEPEVAAAYRAYREIVEAIPEQHRSSVEAEYVCPNEYQAYLSAHRAAEERHEAALERARARVAS